MRGIQIPTKTETLFIVSWRDSLSEFVHFQWEVSRRSQELELRKVCNEESMQSLIDLIVLVEVDDTVPVRVGLPYDFINHGWVVMHHIADLEAFPPSPGPTRPSTVNCSSCQRVPTSSWSTAGGAKQN